MVQWRERGKKGGRGEEGYGWGDRVLVFNGTEFPLGKLEILEMMELMLTQQCEFT